MSSNNYGDKDLKIVIPIEIIPEEVGINEAIKETKDSIKKGRSEKFYDDSVFTQMDDDNETLPKGRAQSIPNDGNNPIQTLKRLTGKSGLLQGVAPYNPSYMKTSLEGTANVPQGGQAPIDKKTDYKKSISAPNDDFDAEGFFAKLLGGPARARQAIALLSNPMGAMNFLMSRLGGSGAGMAIGGGAVLAKLMLWVSTELTKKGGLFDRTFKNLIDTRVQILRTREQQQQHLVGIEGTSQLITTTSAGTTNPRDSFNTYTQKNIDELQHESRWAIRTDQGYP